MSNQTIYGLVKCSFVAGAPTLPGANPHYQLHVRFTQDGQQQDYEVPINTQSLDHTNVLYLLNNNFQNDPLTSQMVALEPGFYPLPSEAGGLALDYVRKRLVDFSAMQPVPAQGLDDDIQQLTDSLPDDSVLYLFGHQYSDSHHNKALDFQTTGGIHEIHMCQGDSGSLAKDDGPYRDGAMLVNIPSQNKWMALFFAFQNQVEDLKKQDVID